MKSLKEYLEKQQDCNINESKTFTKDNVQMVSDLLNIIAKTDKPIKTDIEKKCPAIKNFANFMGNNEKALLDTLQDKFAKAAESPSNIRLTKNESNLIQRIVIFVYKNAFTLNADISNLYHNILSMMP